MRSLFDLKEEIGKRIEFAVVVAVEAVAMAEQAGCGCRRSTYIPQRPLASDNAAKTSCIRSFCEINSDSGK